jgi:hypothetical protein
MGGGEAWLRAQGDAEMRLAIAAAADADTNDNGGGDGSRGKWAGRWGSSSTKSPLEQANLVKAMGWSTQLSARQLEMANHECGAALRRLVTRVNLATFLTH